MKLTTLSPAILVVICGAVLLATSCGGGKSSSSPSQMVPAVNLSAQPQTINPGSSAVLTWSSSNASSLSLDNGIGAVQPNGSVKVSPAQSTTYHATATGPGGTAQATATVTVTNSAGTSSPVEHIVVVVMQNNTFDHLFGFFPAPASNTVDGPHAGVAGFAQTDGAGKSVTPFLLTNIAPPALPESRAAYLAAMDNGLMDKFARNNGDISMGYYDNTIPGIGTLWTYAQQFALSDHYFQSVIGEAPSNQLYMVAAFDNDSPFSVQPSFGPCQKPDPAAQPLSFPNVGDQLSAKGIAWAVFEENYKIALAGNCTSFNPEHDPFQYFVSTQNGPHIQDFSNFSGQVQNGTLPPVTFVIPGLGHDMHPGNGPMTGGTTFLNNLVTELQGSPLWNNTAVVITFDTGGGWYDHEPPAKVDSQGLGFRVPLLVISPWAKKGYVSHVAMDHVSILKFIQFNWGLGPLGQPGSEQNTRNLMGNDISDMFQFNPPPNPLP